MKKIFQLLFLLLPVFAFAQDRKTPSQPLRSKDLSYINLLDYGGGSADDSIPFKNACADAVSTGLLRVRIPAGTYITGSVNAPIGITFFGDGAGVTRIKQRSTSPTLGDLFISAGNITFKDLTLDGNATNLSGGKSTSLIQSIFVNGVTCINVNFVNATNYALQNYHMNTIYLKSCTFDSVKNHVSNSSDVSNFTAEDCTVYGWDKGNSAQSAFGFNSDVRLSDIHFTRLTTYNKFSSSNFAIESGGSSAQLVHVTIQECHFYSNNGSGGVSMGLDSSTVQNNSFDNSTAWGLGIECSGSANKFIHNFLTNCYMALNTNTADSSKQITLADNIFSGNISANLNYWLYIGGIAHRSTITPGVQDGFDIYGNTFDGRGITVFHDINLGNYAAIRSRTNNIFIHDNVGYGHGSADTFLIVSGRGGSNIQVYNNKKMQGYTCLVAQDSTATYTNVSLRDNFIPGAAISGTNVNNTLFPNYTVLGNITDTTINQNFVINNTSPPVHAGQKLMWNGTAFAWTDTLALANIYLANGLLSADRTVSGNSHAMIFGSSGSAFTSYETNTTNGIKLVAGTNISLQGAIATQSVLSDGAPATSTIGNTYSNYVTTNSSLVSSAVTYTLPASPPDGMDLYVNIGGSGTNGTPSITSLSFSPNSGQTLLGPVVTTANYGDFFWFHYYAGITTWFRRH